MYYRLVDRVPTPCTHEVFIATMAEYEARRVDYTQVSDGVSVSTVFLGMSMTPNPALFETLVFGGVLDGYMQRCATWDEAIAQHEYVCAEVRSTHRPATDKE